MGTLRCSIDLGSGDYTLHTAMIALTCSVGPRTGREREREREGARGRERKRERWRERERGRERKIERWREREREEERGSESKREEARGRERERGREEERGRERERERTFMEAFQFHQGIRFVYKTTHISFSERGTKINKRV